MWRQSLNSKKTKANYDTIMVRTYNLEWVILGLHLCLKKKSLFVLVNAFFKDFLVVFHAECPSWLQERPTVVMSFLEQSWHPDVCYTTRTPLNQYTMKQYDSLQIFAKFANCFTDNSKMRYYFLLNSCSKTAATHL